MAIISAAWQGNLAVELVRPLPAKCRGRRPRQLRKHYKLPLPYERIDVALAWDLSSDFA
jgi:hypothetical protein